MSNIFDYLTWRGDLPFVSAPLCPVDTLLFSMLPYIRLEGLVPALPTADPVGLGDALLRYAERRENADSKHLPLIRAMSDSTRFSSLRLVGAVKELDREKGLQFAAITLLLPGQQLFVAFEGTDNTLIGWAEDLRMSYECPVPAQLKAVDYLHGVAEAHPLRRILVGGHSKGGNLAMYAAVHCKSEHRHRIRAVYNHDGPGFCDNTLSTPMYTEMRERIHVFLPESSIVAVLLEHDDHHRIVKSTARGLGQHDPYSWQVEGSDFVYAAERTAFGRETEAIVDRLVNELTPAQKRRFTEGLFSLLESTGETTLSGIAAGKLQSLKSILRSLADPDPAVQALLWETALALGRALKESRQKKQ